MPRILPAVLALCTLLALAPACGGDEDAGSSSAGAGSIAVATPTASATSATAGDNSGKPTPAPTPDQSALGVTDEPVRFETPDGVTIHAHLYSVPGPKRKAVILAHDGTNDQTAWKGFAEALAQRGVAALTLDFRGYGETGGKKDPQNIDKDLETAYLLLKSREYPMIYAIGSTMGATAVLEVAARRDFTGVALISAGGSEDVAGAAAVKVTEPKLYVASKDAPKASEIDAFMSISPDPKEEFLVDGDAVGLDILEGPGGDALREKLLSFLGVE